MATQRPVHIDSTTGNVRELVAGDKLGGVTGGTAANEALAYGQASASLASPFIITGATPYVQWTSTGAVQWYLQAGVSPTAAGSGNYLTALVPSGKGMAVAQSGSGTLFLMDAGGNVSFGTGSVTPLAKCESRSTTDAQFLASYDASNYVKVQCASTGITTISGLGSAKGLVLTDGIVAGTGTARAKVGGTIRNDITAVGNVGVGEDTLNTWTIPASTLAVNGESLEIEKAFSFAANANAKQVRIKFGAATIYASGAVLQNGGSAIFNIRIVRTSATTQDVYISSQLSSASLLPLPTPYQTTAETLSGTIVLLDTGEATSNNDIVARCHVTQWVAAA